MVLFHVTHTHTAANCAYHDKETIGRTFKKVLHSHVDGTKLVSAYVNAPAHKVMLVIDAVSVEALEEKLDPIMDMGEAVIDPVTDAGELVARRMDQDDA